MPEPPRHQAIRHRAGRFACEDPRCELRYNTRHEARLCCIRRVPLGTPPAGEVGADD
jgi:hypothetical protein